MEQLLEAIEKRCKVSSLDNISRRKSQYKYNVLTVMSVKERRRQELIDKYRREREALHDAKRGLLSDTFSDNEEWMDWQETNASFGRKWINKNCKNQLMLSEWLLDQPENLDTGWTTILCPEGRRTLVIARKGCTRAYLKNGYLLAKFKSILPNGSSHNFQSNSDKFILDCIWVKKTKQLFALDVLFWKNQHLHDCDAQFRLYWLKSKVNELKQDVPIPEDVYDVFLPNHCTLSMLSQTLSETDPSEVDGILFYHNRAPYVAGQTPLVGWLKPYMLPERFGIEIPEQYMVLKPQDYVDLEQWVDKVSHSHSRGPKKKTKKNKEEVDTELLAQISNHHCSSQDQKTTNMQVEMGFWNPEEHKFVSGDEMETH